MSGMLGVELPTSSAANQQFQLYGYASPPVEIIEGTADLKAVQIAGLGDGTQIWKINHNGVDTHTIHTHLFNAQLINRVAWDGALLPPDANELGWKETFRVNPLEQTVIAMRPSIPTITQVPFLDQIPNSVRLIDPTMPEGATLKAPPPTLSFFDPLGNQIGNITNHYVNFGWEYVYHCHILAHEEMDMMHGVGFAIPPKAPTLLTGVMSGSGTKRQVLLTWTDNSINETGFVIERALDSGFTLGLTTFKVGKDVQTYTDLIGKTKDPGYYYRVFAANTVGDAMTPGFPTMTVVSDFSNVVMVGAPQALPPADPTNLTATFQAGPQVLLTWTDNADNETGFVVERQLAGAADWTVLVTVGPRTGTGSVSYTDTTVAAGNTYNYRVAAVNSAGTSAYTNTATADVPAPPLAPTNFTATAFRQGGNNARVTLTWTDVVNDTGYVIQRATDANFTANVVTSLVGANATTFTTGNVPRNTPFYFRILAYNGAGQSAWVNATPFPITTP